MSKKEIPTFRSEEEEREFWAEHDSSEYVDWTHWSRALEPEPSAPTPCASHLVAQPYVLARCGRVSVRGDFVWGPAQSMTVRARAGTGIGGERIAPEEYREAALVVLRGRGALPRPQLTAEIRSLLGYSRTGAKLDELIGAAIDGLLGQGTAGQASAGICLRA